MTLPAMGYLIQVVQTSIDLFATSNCTDCVTTSLVLEGTVDHADDPPVKGTLLWVPHPRKSNTRLWQPEWNTRPLRH